MQAPTPVLGCAAGAPCQQPHGRPKAAGDLGAELRQDLLDRIDWQWLEARLRLTQGKSELLVRGRLPSSGTCRAADDVHVALCPWLGRTWASPGATISLCSGLVGRVRQQVQECSGCQWLLCCPEAAGHIARWVRGCVTSSCGL